MGCNLSQLLCTVYHLPPNFSPRRPHLVVQVPQKVKELYQAGFLTFRLVLRSAHTLVPVQTLTWGLFVLCASLPLNLRDALLVYVFMHHSHKGRSGK